MCAGLARRPWLRRALTGGAIVAVAICIAIGGLAWRLSSGPIAVSFLTDDIAAAATARMPEGFTLDIADTELARSERGGVHLSLREVAVKAPDGEVLLAAQRAALGLSPGRLFSGTVLPRSVWLVEPSLTVFDTPEGLRLRAGADPMVSMRTPAELAGVLLALVNEGALQSVGFRDAAITVDRDGKQTRLPPVSLGMFDGRGSNDLRFMATLGEELGTPRIRGTMVREPDEDLVVEATLNDFAVTDLGALLPDGLPVSFDSPMNGEVTFRVDGGGRVEAASAGIAVGAGHIGLGTRRLLIDEADIAVEWNDTTGQLSILPSTVLAGDSRATISADISVPDRGEFNYGTIPIRVELEDVEIGDGEGGAPAVYPSISAEAFYVSGQRILHINRLDLAAPNAAMSFVGFAGGGGESPGIRLAGSMVPMAYDALDDVWPPFLGPNTRRWVLRHLDAGTITEGRVTVQIEPGELAAMARGVPLPEKAYLLEFGVEDVDFRYLGDMPPISGARGTARLTPSTFDLRMDEGAIVQIGEEERIEVGSGRFHIADRRLKPATGEITLEIAGTTSAMLDLLDHEPLRVASRRNLDPADFGGRGTFDVGMSLPLIDGLRISDVGLTVDGTIEGFSASNFSGATSVEDGEMRVSVADGRFSVAGEAVVDGVPAEIALEDSLDGEGAPGAQAVTLRLDEEARERLGIPLGDLLSGPILATVADVSASSDGTSQRIEADFTEARIDFAPLGLDKPAGEPASATFQLAQDEESIRLSEIAFRSGAIRIEGEAEFARGGGLVRLDLPVVRTARGTDVSVTGAAGSGTEMYTLSGAALDLRPVLRGFNGRGGAATPAEGDAAGGGRYSVEIDVDEAIGYHGEALSDVAAKVDHAGGVLSRLEMSGTTSSGQGVVLRYADDGTNADLSADTGDGGRLLAWSGTYPNMQGGRMRLAASRRGADVPLAGRLVINGFAIANDPSLARLIESGERDRGGGRQPAGDSFNPSNVGFDTLAVPFIKGASGVQIREGVLRGPAVGATIEGNVDLAGDSLRLHGTYVPLYALNNLFGQLPILGTLLGGKRNEGMFGVTYSLAGPLDGPVLTINPLSLVAPGVFRYILGMDNPQAFTPQSSRKARDPSLTR